MKNSSSSAALLLTLLAGCSVGHPPALRDDPEVRAIKKRAGLPKLALAPVCALYSMNYDLKTEPGQMPARLDTAAFTAALAADIDAFTGFSPVVRAPAAVVGAGHGADRPIDLARCFEASAKAGAEILMVPRLIEFTDAFDRRNGKWVWNVALWLYLWVPSFWVQDEDYRAEARLDCDFYDVASERLLYTAHWRREVVKSLDDFDRGWDLLGIFRVPNSLDADQMGKVGALLNPFVTRALEKDAVVELGKRLPDYLEKEAANPAAAARDSSAFALLAGISKYHDDAMIAGPPGAAADVAEMRGLLDRTLRVPAKNIRTLSNVEATKERFLADLHLLLSRARAKDTVVVYFSGCGWNGPGAGGAGDAYLLPVDANARDLAGTSISLSELAKTLEALHAGRAFVIADAAFGQSSGGNRSLKPPVAPAGACPDGIFRAATAKRNVQLFLANGSDAGDALDLREAHEGLFTYFLVEGARGRADADADKEVSLAELAAYVARHVKNQADLEGVAERPALYRDGAPVDISQPHGGGSWIPVGASAAVLEGVSAR